MSVHSSLFIMKKHYARRCLHVSLGLAWLMGPALWGTFELLAGTRV